MKYFAINLFSTLFMAYNKAYPAESVFFMWIYFPKLAAVSAHFGRFYSI